MKQQKLLTLTLGSCLSFLLALPALAEVNDAGNDISLAEEDSYLDEGVSIDEKVSRILTPSLFFNLLHD